MAPQIQVTIEKDTVTLTDYKAADTRGLQNAIQGEEVELCINFMNPFLPQCFRHASCKRVHLFNAGQLLFEHTGKKKYKARRWSRNAVARDDSSRPPRRSGPVTFGQAPPVQRVAYSVPLPSYNLPFDEDLLPRTKAEALENRFRFAVDGPDQRQTLKQLGCGFHSADQQIDLVLKQRLHDTSEFLSKSRTLSKNVEIKVRRLLHQLQYVEECKMTIVLLQYSQENIKIQSCRRNFPNAFEVPAPGVTENRPSVLRGDRIEASIHGRNRWHVGFVHFVELDKLIVSFDSGSDVARNWRNSSFDMIFSVGNRTQQRTIHRAIDYGFLLSRESILKLENCNSLAALEIKNRSLKPQLLSFISNCDSFPPTQELNPEQQKFVATVGSQNFCLVVGPPGTGKTSSVVASILFTLYRASQQRSRVKMLIACPSNAACDLIVERLAEADQKYGLGMLFRRPFPECPGRFVLRRIHALSRNPRDVSDRVKFFSQPSDSYFTFPEKADELLDTVDIVVVTLATAGKLLGVGLPTKDSFSHVFVDEAGQVTEQELLLATTFVTPGKTTLALAGDERQLGPIIHSGLCKDGGMQISAFERLVHPSVVPESSVVNLIRNYRSLASIVHIVNVSYNDQLKASRRDANDYSSKNLPWMQKFVRSSSSSLLCNTNGNSVWTNRAKQSFPDHGVAFIHNEGPESRDPDSPSWKNISEKDIVLNLVKSLVNDGGVNCEDITVLTPYLLQRKKIEMSLHRGCFIDMTIKVPSKYLNDHKPRCPIQVATVEAFQGKENKIIIVSCVRSSQADTKQVTTDIRHKLGFFSQVQRTNVALSRARDAMFVIGNAKLFLQDYSRHASTIVFDDDGEPEEHQNPLWDEVLNRIDDYGCILNMQSQSGGNLKTIKNQLRGRSGRDFQIGEINSDEEENTEGAAIINDE